MHASESKRRLCVLRTCLRFAIERKRKKKEGAISTFTLLNYEMICGFAQVQVSFHYQGKQLCGLEKDILDFFIVRFDKSAVS